MEFATERMWTSAVSYWTGLPDWLQIGLPLLFAALVLIAAAQVGRARRMPRRVDMHRNGSPPRSPEEKYPYLEFFQGASRFTAWAAMVGLGLHGGRLIFAGEGGELPGILFIASGLIAFVAVHLVSEAIRLALNLERYLRNLHYLRSIAPMREAARATDEGAGRELN